MIRLERRPCPSILETRSEEWTAKFLTSGKKRPDPSKYRHREIVATLRACSSGKCFTCERAVAESEGEVDHHVEVEHERSRAYDWSNLFWACKGCNDKLPERTIPRDSCLDPFDPARDPADHLSWDDEKVFARDGSDRGRRTIDKYKLNRLDLELARSRALREFQGLLLDLVQREGRWDPVAARELLARFRASDRPFSAMFRALDLGG